MKPRRTIAAEKGTRPPRPDSVEDYLATLPPAKARTLRSIIDLILAQFPELQCKIAWNVPQIHRHGKYVFGLSASKHHLTLAPWSQQVMTDFAPRFGNLITQQNCFQIPIDWPLDRPLLHDLVRARLAELDAESKGESGK